MYKIIISLFITINICYYSIENIGLFNKPIFIQNNKLEGIIISKKDFKSIDNVVKKYKSYSKAKVLSDSGMFIDLYSNNKISFLDIPLHGNFGKNGIQNMINNIKNDTDTYYLIDSNNNYTYQFAYELTDYIKNNYTKVDQIENYDIYYVNKNNSK